MVEKRRGPGRPAYDSKQKLVVAMCALLAERGFEATSPTMVLQRSGIGHGSLYHHYRGKEDLALDAISHMRGHAIAFLEGQAQHTPPADDDEVDATIAAALDRLFARREGQALIRLLADPVAGAIRPLATATQEWSSRSVVTSPATIPRLPKPPPASSRPSSPRTRTRC
mgnify:CR=1 FL=1